MAEYLARRALSLVPVWLGISLLAFVLANIAPGDPAVLILEARFDQPPTAEQVDDLRHELGLDRPLPVRYLNWVGDAVTGDLGDSYRTNQPVFPELRQRLWVTLQLAIPALILALVIAITVGVVSAVRRNTVVDHGFRAGALLGASVPGFALAYLLIIVFSVRFGWLPVAGRGTWKHLVLPAVTLGIAPAALMTRLTRSAMLEVLGQNYLATARAVGLNERTVLLRRALKNALIPVVTVAGLRFGHLLAGAAIIEVIFAWPGIGQLVVDAIGARDYPVIQGYVIVTGTLFVLVNLTVDVIYVALDPRVRLGGKKTAA